MDHEFPNILTIFEEYSFGNPLIGVPNTLLPFIKAFIIKLVTKIIERKIINCIIKNNQYLLRCKYTYDNSDKVSYFFLIIQLQDYDSDRKDLQNKH